MSAADKIKNAAQDLTGKAKEAAGKVTHNEELQDQGKAGQTKADAKNADEIIKRRLQELTALLSQAQPNTKDIP